MVLVSAGSSFAASNLTAYYTTDPDLSNAPIIIFYGLSKTVNASAASSRVQCHVFTPAGLASYPRLSISPGSPLYTAVTCLPREEQGDEIRRALTFSLFKYFEELSTEAKDVWIQESLSSGTLAALKLFHEQHAADLASRMVQATDSQALAAEVDAILSERHLSFLDVDVILPSGSISRPSAEDGDPTYGQYNDIVQLLGDTAFIPTSKLKRAPSKPMAVNKTLQFAQAQRETIKLEIQQLRETEENYISKLHDLLNEVAVSFREAAESEPTLQSANAVRCLFPPSLDTIFSVNFDFLNSLRVLDLDGGNPEPHAALAACLAEFVPKFVGSYKEYIRTHDNSAAQIKTILHIRTSAVATKLEEFGEKKLSSLLIEPIQRLPRYNLYIDNITKQLPISDPSLRLLLKAKDDISSICAGDGETADKIDPVDRLRSLVYDLPPTLSSFGRFVSVCDGTLVSSPFNQPAPSMGSARLLLILFTNFLIFVRKAESSTVSARSLQLHLENPRNTLSSGSNELVFDSWTSPLDVVTTESREGKSVHVLAQKVCSSTRPSSSNSTVSSGGVYCKSYVIQLGAPYEGRTSTWIHELSLARVESRFSTHVRESNKWEVRSMAQSGQSLALVSAIFEDDVLAEAGTNVHGACWKVVIDPKRCSSAAKGRDPGSVLISITPEGDGFFCIETECSPQRGTRDKVMAGELTQVLCKRVASLVEAHLQMQNSDLAPCLFKYYADALGSLKVFEAQATLLPVKRVGSTKSHSPVKALTSLFGSISKTSPTKSSPTKSILLDSRWGETPPEPPPSNTKPILPPKAGGSISKGSPVRSGINAPATNPIAALEATFATYIVAIQARRGNIVGRVVANRSQADEAVVNELYNSLLESAANLEKAAHVSVDELFAAFEKFLNNAWKDTMGPVVTLRFLEGLQQKLDTLNPFDFDEHLSTALDGLAPQNRRAFSSLISLLTEILESTGNDGDRGALTVAFAEILTQDQDAMSVVPLFDRLVEDQEGRHQEALLSSATASGKSTSKSDGNNGGSTNSKSSSWRNRLGLGSLQRTLSKGKGASETPSKPLLGRTRSVDTARTLATDSRPTSSGQASAYSISNSPRPPTGHSFDNTPNTSNSGAGSSLWRAGSVLRKKRRSSLSDLHSLKTPSHPNSPSRADNQGSVSFLPPLEHSSPFNISPSRSTQAAEPSTPSLNRKENVPPRQNNKPERAHTPSIEGPRPLPSPPQFKLPARPSRPGSPSKLSKDPVIIHSDDNQANRDTPDRQPSRSPSIEPPPRGILVERPGSGNTPPRPGQLSGQDKPSLSPSKRPLPPSPTKLRVQSPQKLRERVSTQHSDVEAARGTLQVELDKIAAEFDTARSLKPSPSTTSSSSPVKPNAQDSGPALQRRLRAAEVKIDSALQTLGERAAQLERDVSDSLTAADRKNRELDQMLLQANVEVDAVYRQNAAENARLFGLLKAAGSGGVEELRRRLRESMDDAAALRKENAELRRKNLHLRAQLDLP